MVFARNSTLPDRRAILAGLSVALVTCPANAACPPTRVLFVCQAGSVKSAIARETLKQLAAQNHLPVAVSSRGLSPEDHVSPTLAANLQADGIDPASEPLRALADADIARADIVIAFDEAADASILHTARSWRTPSWNTDYAGAKADLTQRLGLLMTELRARADLPCAAR